MAFSIEEMEYEYDLTKLLIEQGLNERREVLGLYIMMDTVVLKRFKSEANKNLVEKYKLYLEENITASNKEDELLQDIVDYMNYVISEDKMSVFGFTIYPKMFMDILSVISKDRLKRVKALDIISQSVVVGLTRGACDVGIIPIGTSYDPELTDEKINEFKEKFPKK